MNKQLKSDDSNIVKQMFSLPEEETPIQKVKAEEPVVKKIPEITEELFDPTN